MERREHTVSKSEEFRQYAEEALRSAAESKTEAEKNALIDLARTWTLAALSAESPPLVSEPPRNPTTARQPDEASAEDSARPR